jgi:chromosome segregation ATPase
MQELEKRIGLLRLLLADIQGKQSQLHEMENQYREQLSRIVDFVVYREGDVSNALSLMGEVQSKLDEVVATVGHLKMIQERGSMELDALVLTKRVAEARSQLSELETRQKELMEKLRKLPAGEPQSIQSAGIGEQLDDITKIQAEVAGVSSEIARLHGLIAEASERAARTVQPRKISV